MWRGGATWRARCLPMSFILLSACAGQPPVAMPISEPLTVQATAPQPTGPDPVQLRAVIDRIGQQVRRCYRTPVRLSAARQIVTVMQVRFGPDGMLAAMPLVAGQSGITPEGAPYAGVMAEAARTAIIRCTPIAAPVELHQNGWSELYLTFSPKGSA